ncbi:MAG TPA: hypothetical protein H9814_04470 [Candidatus Bacteroides merdigallinarum]|uniref:Transmembrane protein n=1 Tax=Candidatus Bacteroides merdigallinarum TaxID=2838473 RepID=A0A9D2E871_9BACE|nr:hypothetical protein [Candidatus Bacteroides merdigallinarum]
MGALVNILMYSVGSLLLGVFLTIVGIVLMFVLIRSWWRDSTFTPMSFVVGGILFFFLAFQAVLLCGAVTIKSYCDDVETAINGMVAAVPDDIPFSTEDSQQILDRISEEWPLVGYYVNMADFQGHTSATIGAAMADELRSYMNRFILRRVCWSLVFVVIGAIIVIKTITRSHNRQRLSSGRMTERAPMNRPRGTTQRQNRIRVSRRR